MNWIPDDYRKPKAGHEAAPAVDGSETPPHDTAVPLGADVVAGGGEPPDGRRRTVPAASPTSPPWRSSPA